MKRTVPTGTSLKAIVSDRRVALWSASSIVAVLIFWEVAADLHLISQYFFSSPSAIVATGLREVQEASFWSDLGISTLEFVVGYCLAMLVGIPLGFLIGWNRRTGYVLEPWLHGLNSTPTLALMPLVVLWFGLGIESKFAIVFISAMVPVVVNLYVGVRTLDPRLLRVARSFGARRRVLLRSIIIPGLLSFVFVAARIAVGRSVSGVVVGEFYASQSGLASRIFQAGINAQTSKLFFGALTITVLAMLGFRLVDAVQNRALAWRRVTPTRARRAALVVPTTARMSDL
ncbi:MAG TPA: ABC transporter permease [Candidatus Limnocylindrales bacterium]|nr:ABC transporter permease [Candidatus Limnocylindrales bacterium]